MNLLHWCAVYVLERAPCKAERSPAQTAAKVFTDWPQSIKAIFPAPYDEAKPWAKIDRL